MAWTPPGAGELRQRVRFEKRTSAENDGGIVRSDWGVLIDSRRVQLLPVRGGEATAAMRATGQDLWTLVVRSCSATRAVTTDHRVASLDQPGVVFDIRSVLDLEGRGRWLVMTLERGKGDGRQGA